MWPCLNARERMTAEDRSGTVTHARDKFLLEVRNLSVDYYVDSEDLRPAIRNLSFRISPGEIVGVLGESGSGKSTLALALLGLLPGNARISAGSVLFRGQDLLRLSQDNLRQYRGAVISLIFQEPAIALNPVLRAGDQVSEMIQAHRRSNRRHRRELALEALRGARLSMASEIYSAYPHELSGGQQQRVMIAQALVCKPALLIADEPTSALDVTTQADVLAYLKESAIRLKAAILIITHDPTTLAGLADRVLVLHRGELVEDDIFDNVSNRPVHDYTRSVFSSIPKTPTAKLPAPEQSDVLIARRISKKYAGKRWWGTRGGRDVQAVSDVSLTLRAGSTTGLVGESGCGKSTLARCLAAIEKPDAGEVWVEGCDELRERRRAIQLIFQNTAAALNPWLTLEEIVAEPLAIRGLPLKQRRDQARALMEELGLPASRSTHRPTELSGGQRQRLALARALAAQPKILVLDEALSGLDLPVQAQIVELLKKLQESRALAYLFITHDLRMAGQISDKIAVMQAGRIVEYRPALELFSDPQHHQTRSLLKAIPKLDV